MFTFENTPVSTEEELRVFCWLLMLTTKTAMSLGEFGLLLVVFSVNTRSELLQNSQRSQPVIDIEQTPDLNSGKQCTAFYLRSVNLLASGRG